ncbi:hypothetical protein F2Q65_17325 [Thiohalocapsa marina]|uniref:Uncharacterized protein n=1 Tax=Thiohalocapsa marina TaxID=424902 RepID=A0A5M8FCX3_9GAMM|nr:hypothetical protein [Thiohalocapsa marina]KAA6182733.1 hypothetical protein F2Q65_17325 [Thiohalocapsa marina]
MNLLLWAAAIWLLFAILSAILSALLSITNATFRFLLFIILLPFAIPWALYKEHQQRKYIRSKSIQYQTHLAKRRMSLIRTDHYGDEDRSRWDAEMKYFLKHKVSPVPDQYLLPFGESRFIDDKDAMAIIDEVAKAGQLKRSASPADSD